MVQRIRQTPDSLATFLQRQHIDINLVGIKSPKILQGVTFRYGVLAKALDSAIARATAYGRKSIKMIFPVPNSAEAIRELFAANTPSLVHVDEEGNLVVTGPRVNFKGNVCLGEEKPRATLQALQAIEPNAIIIVGETPQGIYSRNELLACRLLQEPPVYLLGECPAAIKGLDRLAEPQILLALAEALPSYRVDLKPVYRRLAEVLTGSLGERINAQEEAMLAKLAQVATEEEAAGFLQMLAKGEKWEAFAYFEGQFADCPVKIAAVAIPILLEIGAVNEASHLLERTVFQALPKAKKKGSVAHGPQQDFARAIKEARKKNNGAKSPESVALELFDTMVAGQINFLEFFAALPHQFSNTHLIAMILHRRLNPATYQFFRTVTACQEAQELNYWEGEMDEEQCFRAWQYHSLGCLFRAFINEVYEKTANGRLTGTDERAVLDLMLHDDEFEFLPPAELMPALLARGRSELRGEIKGQAHNATLKVSKDQPAAFVFGTFILFDQSLAKEALGRKDFAEALAYYERLLEVAPADKALQQETVECLYEWAVALHQLDGQTRKPLELMQKAYAIIPDHSGVQGVLSYFYCLEDNYEPALPILNEADLRQKRELRELDLAVKKVDRQVAQFPENDPRTPAIRAAQAQAHEHYQLFKQGYADTLTNLGHCYQLKYLQSHNPQDLVKAESFLDQAKALSDSPYTAFCLAIVMALKGDFAKAHQGLAQRLKFPHAVVAFMSFFEKIIDHVDVSLINQQGFRELGEGLDKGEMNRPRCFKASFLVDRFIKKGLIELASLLLDWLKNAVEEQGNEFGESEYLGRPVSLATEFDTLIVTALSRFDPVAARQECLARLAQRPCRLLLNTLAGIYFEQGDLQGSIGVLETAAAAEDMPHLLLPLVNLLEPYRKVGDMSNYSGTIKKLMREIEAAIEAGVVGQFKYMSYYKILFEEETQIAQENPNLLPAVQKVLALLKQNFPDYYQQARAEAGV